jgi:hypothetical protein
MTRRVLRTQGSAVFPLIVLAAISLGSPAVSACSENDPFVKLHCAFDSNPRVSENRVVTLTAFNYAYVFAAEQDRNDYLDQARSAISGAYEVANRIFKEEGVNLQILSWTILEKDVPGLTVSGFSPNSALMADVHKESRFIGVHWSEWLDKRLSELTGNFASSPCPNEQCNWVNLSGMVRNWPGEEELGRELARSFGYYFDLNTEVNQTNLMSETNQGTHLTTSQRDAIWSSINTFRTKLLSITCDPPVEFAPMARDQIERTGRLG